MAKKFVRAIFPGSFDPFTNGHLDVVSRSIRLFDEPFSERVKERIGYLPEERGLYRKMKVLEHLVFLGEIKGEMEVE